MLKAESAEIVVAGGMESMTNAPHLTFARKGIRYGAAQLYDHMAIDGLEDAYERGKAMGVFAEQCVDKYKFTREAMDQFAIASTERSKKANEDGSFDWEIAPVSVPGKGGDTVIKFDEQPFKAKLDKIPGLKPAFKKDGTITAADLVEHLRRRRGAGADARVDRRRASASSRSPAIVGHTVHAQAPAWFTTAPVGAIDKLLKKTGWNAKDVDLWEVNEAFAAVTMAAMSEFKLPHEIVNVNGGAVALGHPIGASGARIVVTLLGALQEARQEEGRRGALHRRRRGDGAGGRDDLGPARRSLGHAMLGTHSLGVFALTVFVVNATPGVDMIFVLTRTLRHGVVAGIAAALGVAAGCVVHTLVAAFGLAALLAASSAAFALVKYAGAAYLVWLAIGMLRAGVAGDAALARSGRRRRRARGRCSARASSPTC